MQKVPKVLEDAFCFLFLFDVTRLSQGSALKNQDRDKSLLYEIK
jgi:hypothetical protein